MGAGRPKVNGLPTRPCYALTWKHFVGLISSGRSRVGKRGNCNSRGQSAAVRYEFYTSEQEVKRAVRAIRGVCWANCNLHAWVGNIPSMLLMRPSLSLSEPTSTGHYLQTLSNKCGAMDQRCSYWYAAIDTRHEPYACSTAEDGRGRGQCPSARRTHPGRRGTAGARCVRRRRRDALFFVLDTYSHLVTLAEHHLYSYTPSSKNLTALVSKGC